MEVTSKRVKWTYLLLKKTCPKVSANARQLIRGQHVDNSCRAKTCFQDYQPRFGFRDGSNNLRFSSKRVIPHRAQHGFGVICTDKSHQLAFVRDIKRI